MNLLLRNFRTLISIPFAMTGICLMGIAVWIMPKPKRLENRE